MYQFDSSHSRRIPVLSHPFQVRGNQATSVSQGLGLLEHKEVAGTQAFRLSHNQTSFLDHQHLHYLLLVQYQNFGVQVNLLLGRSSNQVARQHDEQCSRD